MGKNIRGSWICNDCMTERDKEEETTSANQDNSNDTHHGHIGAANKSDVSSNTPKVDEVDLLLADTR
jgi:hypothetical protein